MNKDICPIAWNQLLCPSDLSQIRKCPKKWIRNECLWFTFKDVWPSTWIKMFEQGKYEMATLFWVWQQYDSLLRTYQKGESLKDMSLQVNHRFGNSLLRTYVLKWSTFLNVLFCESLGYSYYEGLCSKM